MPFDPNFPTANTLADAVAMRAQLNALNDKIDSTLPGPPGPQGEPGPQGPPGEVTTAALTAAIAGTSANTNAVPTLDTPYADPEKEELWQRLNELILAARR
ncbi:MAG: hypothetical protein ABMA13_21670 [Chthoniobacteraceae bacterium]